MATGHDVADDGDADMTPLPCDRERSRLSAREHAPRLETLRWVMDELCAPDLSLGRATYLREVLFELMAQTDAGSDSIRPYSVSLLT